VFFGQKDHVLAPKVTDKAVEYYKFFRANVKYVVNSETAHPVPTDLPESKPDALGRKKVDPSNGKFPYINNCGVDAAGEML